MSHKLPDRLQTARLVIRKPRESDAREIFDAYAQDPQVALYMVWRPHIMLAETELFVSKCVEDWNRGHRQAYVLALLDSSDTPIGMLDTRSHSHIVDIGYVLARSHWGNGLMPEAIRALVQAALASSTIFRIQATCDAENIASARALEKAGFTQEGLLSRYAIHPNLSQEPRSCFMYARCR